MKLNNIPRPVLIIFISGLLFTTLTPALGRYLHLSDFLKGFMSGLGLMLEVIALIKIQQTKQHKNCINK